MRDHLKAPDNFPDTGGMLKAGFRCSTAGMRLILRGNSEARAMLAPQTLPELDYRHEINKLRLRTV
jgi:hypothetical protein